MVFVIIVLKLGDKMKKTHDIVVKVGSFTDKEGKTKNRYINVGSKMEGDNGAFFLLNRTFNPAGVPNPDNRDSVILSLFEVKEKDAQQSNPTKQVTEPSDIDWAN